MTHPARVIIDLQAAVHNLAFVQKAAPKSRILAIIKADAYGHGVVRMANMLAEADAFGVASIEEAVVLGEAKVKRPIVLLEGFFEVNDLEAVREYNLELVIHTKEQVEMLRGCKVDPLPIWLKLNTGMNRLGFELKDLKKVYADVKPISSPLRLMTHFANANILRDSSVILQTKKFFDATLDFAEEKTLANSGGIMGWPCSHAEWVRPGLMLYGISPFSGKTGLSVGLKPVMKLQSKLISVRNVFAGGAVGYGSEFVCPEDMLVGTVAYGYGDGYPRNIRAGAPVLVKGFVAKIIGSSMDMTMLDLRGVPQPEYGDIVTLWGPDLPVEKVAEALGTIPYELLCRVRMRAQYEELPLW